MKRDLSEEMLEKAFQAVMQETEAPARYIFYGKDGLAVGKLISLGLDESKQDK